MLTSEKKRKQKQKKIRHMEYYNLVDVFDKLYADSKDGKVFTGLIEIITSEENIKLAYRNIKRNTGSNTSGVDGRTIKYVEAMPAERLIDIVRNKLTYYKPQPVKRVEIPKPNGKFRPLGIPTITDRLVQQCILQVLEPICEAKFHERSNGFRPNRSAENAIAQSYKMIQHRNLHFVVDVDIKGFFDNVNHTKLKQQIWSMGIRDKKLICIIGEMLKAPIVMPDNSRIIPTKGTPQGGILSPLLSNIVLNELDWWITSQWENIPIRKTFKEYYNPANGSLVKSSYYRELRKSTLKEMYIVRYADDFKIFCRNYEAAKRIFHAVRMWLVERLKLEISEEKSKVINLRKSYSDFLGFKIKAVPKRGSYTVSSHISDKAVERITSQLKRQILKIESPANEKERWGAINHYNGMVIGIHSYYSIATLVNLDCNKISRVVYPDLKQRLGYGKRGELKKHGNELRGFIKERYGKSEAMRYVNGFPIIPISYVQTRAPMWKRRKINKYTKEGRAEIHKALGVNMNILHALMSAKEVNRSIEYMDNRISLYAAQHGKCAVTGKALRYEEIHCHHVTPIQYGGSDRYSNLKIVHVNVHHLIHAVSPEIIAKYMSIVSPSEQELDKINTLRKRAKLQPITA